MNPSLFFQKLPRGFNRLRFLSLLAQTHPQTWNNNQRLPALLAQKTPKELDPLWLKSQRLQQDLLAQYAGAYKEKKLKILIQIPDQWAIGTQSVFLNWLETLNLMGVAAQTLDWNDPGSESFALFQPDLFISLDHPSFLSRIDWAAWQRLRQTKDCKLALMTMHEHDGASPNGPRIEKALRLGVDYFLSFRFPTYVKAWLGEWSQTGKPVLSVPFGANPLAYYPQPMKEQLDYVFLGSSNPDKTPRYLSYFSPILNRAAGCLVGPGWGKKSPSSLDRGQHSCFYGLGKIGINLHLGIQMEVESELNERCYNLAAAGCFQLVDQPRALRELFPHPDQVVSCASPKEYQDAFFHYLHHPKERLAYQIKGLEAVYQGHCLAHRMAALLQAVI